ncbi:ATP synthase mitochondrial F1 complex assembly factor 2-like [Gigantopelta aegis]|uniref:ATP synthase mitochondrial F1 complex assembly factor 2-like n=1 Tax=Gigantopelta aegis TaxID=1735272 RepID=UPI001B88899D|nr:ATP synthase mitochondrial F1 complex assembly factor 2-like [Gigantopelta aegis]
MRQSWSFLLSSCHINVCLRQCKQMFQKRNTHSSFRELKKFYKNASITTSQGWYEINLDKRKLRTPGGKIFQVPNEALALAVATEWNKQKTHIRQHTMHLTSLCNTAIDNPMHRTRESLMESIIHFLETDTICYRLTEPPQLYELMCNEWDPLLHWAKDRHGIEIEPTTGIATPGVSPQTVETIRRHLMSYSDWALFGYDYAVDAIKSLIIIMALLDREISIDKAVNLARLELEFQIQKWGNVEWHHDLDLYELRTRLSASTLFIHWSNENSSIKEKASLAKQFV